MSFSDNSPLRYDVLVVGGGPAGIGAAVAAARMGAHTAILERSGLLGGMLTAGQVQPILGNVAPGSFYDEVVSVLAQGHEEVPALTTRNGREVHVDVEEAKERMLRLTHESGAEIYLHTPVIQVLKEGSRVTGVVAGTAYGPRTFLAQVVIDATGDGFAAAQAGAPYHIGREQDGRCQPVTIEFLVDNLDESRALSCFGGSDPVTLPDGKKYSQLCREACERGELPQNVSIVRLHKTFYPGERNVNATQANGFDVFDPQDAVQAELTLRGQINSIIAFLRKNVPGYENCRVKSSAATLGVRETRRIEGLRRVEDIDVETGTRCPDVVVHKAWFLIDIHNPAGGGQAEGHSQPAIPYDIPYGALVPRDIEGMFTAGRCISGTHRAHASYRVMAICLATGQAAGTAAALCVQQGKLPSQLDYHAVQAALEQAGCTLFDCKE